MGVRGDMTDLSMTAQHTENKEQIEATDKISGTKANVNLGTVAQ